MQGSISLIKGNKVLSKPPTEECLFIEELNYWRPISNTSFSNHSNVTRAKRAQDLSVSVHR